MNKPIADMWTAALKSGEYTQGKGYLCSESKRGKEYCCLGVLCDLYNKHNPPMETQYRNTMCDTKHTLFDGYNGDLPPVVLEWSGMHSRNGIRDFPKPPLIALNDECGYSFIDIANVIEEEWETL